MGSFLNVVALRFNSGLTLSGRSFCPVCEKKLSAWELIPVFSFLFLKGRCLGCKTKISFQYFLVEVVTGVVFAAIYWATLNSVPNISLLILNLILASIFIVIALYDLKHKIIPDFFVYLSILVSLVYRIYSYFLFPTSYIDWLAPVFLFIFFALVWLFSGGRAMGFGDAKLGVAVGLWLGAAQGFSAIILAFWIGTAAVIIYYLFISFFPLYRRSKRLTMKSEVPFAPFIILGAWFSFILKLDILHVALFLN